MRRNRAGSDTSRDTADRAIHHSTGCGQQQRDPGAEPVSGRPHRFPDSFDRGTIPVIRPRRTRQRKGRSGSFSGATIQRARRRMADDGRRSEEHTSELQSLMRNSYAVFCLKKKKNKVRRLNKKENAKSHNSTQQPSKNRKITNV